MAKSHNKYSSLVRNLLPIIILVGLIYFLFSGTLLPPNGKMLYGGDIYDAYYFWKGHLRTSVLSGVIPFWNPYNFSGTPFLAHPNINIFYPLNLLFILIPPNQSFAVYLFIHFVISGITMYFLCREYTGRIGAYAGALTYALGGYFAARVYGGHPEYIDTASWMPLAFALTRRAIMQPAKGTIVLSVLGLTILLLSGNELFFLFTMELVGLFFIYFIIKRRKDLWRVFFTRVGVILVSVAGAMGLVAIEFLPRLEFLGLSLRAGGISYGLAVSGSFSISLLRLFVDPFFLGKPDAYHGPWPNLTEYTYYVGFIPLLCIGIFIFTSLLSTVVRRLRLKNIHGDIWFFLLLVIPLFFVISLGFNFHPNIHELLWKYLPFYKSLRMPARHLFVVAFSISVVVGMIVGGIKNKVVQGAILVLIIFDLLAVDKQFFRLSDIPSATFDQSLIETLSTDRSLFRLLPDHTVISGVRKDLDLGAVGIYKIQSTSDYNSMLLGDYYHFIDLLNKAPTPSTDYYNVEIPPPFPWSPYVDFLNVKYILSDKTADGIGKNVPGKFKLLKEGSHYKLYENLTFLPRFYLVPNLQTYGNRAELDQLFLSQTSPDLTRIILVPNSQEKIISDIHNDCGQNDLGKVGVQFYSANKIVLNVVANCNTFLSTSEVYYPGWRAAIDGKRVEILKSNLAFRALEIPRGSHKVIFHFEPMIYYLGGLISLLTLVTLVVAMRIRKF